MRTAVAVLALLSLGLIEIRAQEVTLPLADYEELRRRANPTPLPDPSPPAPYAIESNAIEIEIGDDSARVVQRMTVSIFATGWHAIPLAGAFGLTSVGLGTLEGRVVADEERALIVRGVGRHEVRLESVVALVEDSTSARTTRGLELELARAALVTGTIQAGADVDDVRLVSGGLLRPGSGDGRWELVGAPGEILELELLGESRTTVRSDLPLKFQVVSAAATALGRTRLDVRGYVRAEILQGMLETLRFPIPPGLEVVRVEAGEAGWNVEGGALVITPAAPVMEQFAALVVLTGEPAASLDAPLVVPEGASRSTLVSTFKVEGDGLPTLVDTGSARQAQREDLSSFPRWVSSITSTGARAFVVRDAERPPRFSVEWSEDEQQRVLAAQVDRLVVDTVVGTAGHAAYQCWAIVRNSGATSLTFEMPPGFELVRAERDGMRMTPGKTGNGVEVPLVGGAESQIVHLLGFISLSLPTDGADLEVPIPALSVPTGRAEARVVLPGGFSYATRSAHLESSTSSSVVGESLFSVPLGFSVIEASWSALTSRPAPVQIQVKERKHKRRWF